MHLMISPTYLYYFLQASMDIFRNSIKDFKFWNSKNDYLHTPSRLIHYMHVYIYSLHTNTNRVCVSSLSVSSSWFVLSNCVPSDDNVEKGHPYILKYSILNFTWSAFKISKNSKEYKKYVQSQSGIYCFCGGK